MRAWEAGRWALLHLAVLVLARLLSDADDLNNWDLIPFLNAQSFGSLAELLALPEVHFPNPLRFPLYNTGAESALLLTLERGFGAISLYWAPVLTLVAVDAAFVAALWAWLSALFGASPYRALALLLATLSPVLLTALSTSAFNVVGYLSIVSGLLGTELILVGRTASGLAALAVAVALMSQGYPLSYFLPLHLAVWALARRAVRFASGGTAPARRVLLTVAAAAGLVALAQASDPDYWSRVGPGSPYTQGHPLDPALLADRVTSLARSALLAVPPEAAFAPWFLLAFGAALAAIAWRARQSPRLTTAVAWVALIGLGYLPGVASEAVKSQRTLLGDVFLALVLASLAQRLVASEATSLRTLAGVAIACAAMADAHYGYWVGRVDHAGNHYPRFDFDLSDGMVRHDLQQAAEQMRRQVDAGAVVIAYYPRTYSENTSDPGLFHARLLRHFGEARGEDDLIFACRTCVVRYGCPFPEVRGRECASHCCFETPRIPPDRPAYLWWWRGAPFELVDADPVMLIHGVRTTHAVALAPDVPARFWVVYRLEPLGG